MIKAFINTCLRHIFRIKWQGKISDEELILAKSEMGTNRPADPAKEVGLDWNAHLGSQHPTSLPRH